MRMLPAQFTDVATQLAGGQSPWLILLQQGQVRTPSAG
ncbi:phage tail length tape measure family protein [Escherichia coli]